jgi:hypothetical protein
MILKLLDMGNIGMTFLEKPLSVMFCKLTIFKINLLKLIKTLMRMHCNHFLCPLTYTKDIFLITIFPLIIFSIRYKFFMIIIFIPL